MKQHRTWIFLSFLTIVLFLLYPDAAARGMRDGLNVCAVTIIPTLYVYSVMTGVLMKLLPPRGTTGRRPSFLIFILGALCGFPIGARLLQTAGADEKSVFPNIEWLLASVNLASPAYVIGAVGAGAFHDQKIGVLIYLCTTAVALLFFCSVRTCGTGSSAHKAKEDLHFGGVLLSSIENAVGGILKICGVLCFFSSMLAIISDLPFVSKEALLPLSIFLEIGNGTAQCARLYSENPMLSVWSAAFCCGFSGLCVQLQIISVIGSTQIKLYRLCFYKMMIGLFSAFATVFLWKIFGFS